MKLSRTLFLSLTALTLAACAGTGDVDLESRNISVAENAEPAANRAVSQSIAGLIKNAGPTYVTLTISEIDTNGSAGRDSQRKIAITSGSGFLVDRTGYVLTAGHVAVAKGYAVSARAANGRIYSGKVVNILPSNDLALIRLRGFKGHSAAPVSNGCLVRGATLFSLGKPHAQGDTARFGTVESMSFGRPVQYGKFGYPDAMVMRMSTQKGESGGPVFDDKGRLAAMVVSTLSDGNGQPLNLAHAVPSATLAKFLCSNTNCSADWAALARNAGQSCQNN